MRPAKRKAATHTQPMDAAEDREAIALAKQVAAEVSAGEHEPNADYDNNNDDEQQDNDDEDCPKSIVTNCFG